METKKAETNVLSNKHSKFNHTHVRRCTSRQTFISDYTGQSDADADDHVGSDSGFKVRKFSAEENSLHR